ncbi:MAG: GldG family protein [Clostridia bacterium]|nr:GldG family protein [Clostridia bacterium]
MSMNNEKKAKSKLSALLGQRKFRYGAYATILTVVVIAVVILLNVVLGAIETNWALGIDVTAINATDFDDATYEILKGVTEDVRVYTVYQTSTATASRVQVDSVLEKYHALNNHVILGSIDPVKEPTRINKLAGDTNLSEGAVIVTNADETRVKLINRSDYSYSQTFANNTYSIFDLESKMTSALVYVTSTATPRVFFLAGHGEYDRETNFRYLTSGLQQRNYDVATLNLLTDDVTLASGDTVVITNPSRDLDDSEYETLRDWLMDGGRLLVAFDYTVDTSILPNFNRLLDYYQLSFGDGVINENESATGNYVSYGTLYLRPNMDAEHQITSSMAETRQLIIPQVRPINEVAVPESGFLYTKLLTTSNGAVVVNSDSTSTPGTQTVAMSAVRYDNNDGSKDIRIILLGSNYLMLDTQLLYSTDNIYFTINAFDWLVNSDSTVKITSKYAADSVLRIPDATTAWVLAAIVVVAIPLIVLVVGIVVWIKRRRL